MSRSDYELALGLFALSVIAMGVCVVAFLVALTVSLA